MSGDDAIAVLLAMKEVVRQPSLDSNDSELAGDQVSRKDKSLGLLCDNFLQLFASGFSDNIELEAVAARLGVGRRRICACLPAGPCQGPVRPLFPPRHPWS